jgi:hypothetical protein
VTGPASHAVAELDWPTLMDRPSAYIDVTRLAACFDGGIRNALCERLRAADRLQSRLSAIITEFYALCAPVGPEAASAADQKVALLGSGKTREVARRAGAVYWANAIANAVRAEEARWLRARLGEALYTFALANRHLSPASGKFDLTDEVDLQISEDGMRCLGAWCQSQPEAIAQRVRLKSPASAALDDNADGPFKEIGPAIIRCAGV